MRKSVAIIIGFFLLGAFFTGWKITESLNKAEMARTDTPSSALPSTNKVEFNPPSMDDVPEGALGESIRYGYQLITETDTALPEFVGNKLSCISCHAGGGLDIGGSPFVGLTAVYPEYRPREGKVYTLEDRINGCMVRSMNGKMLPYDSEEMRAMIAYMTYISEDIPVGADLPWRMQNSMDVIPAPDLTNGKELYKMTCIACHAADGSGTGSNTGPALWGENSFNDGAGLGRMTKMAGFIQRTMPKGQGGTLSDQEVADLTAYILSMDRPEWTGHDQDWPNGGRPSDIITQDRREEIRNGTVDWDKILKPAQKK